MINNRQNGRRRGRGGNNGGNNGPRGGNPGRPDSGNRIDSRARGNANQLYEKYKNLARDAQMSGDRVNTEYYLQFADHYFRVLSETRMRFEEQNPNAPQQRRIQPVDSFDDFDGDEDYGDEGEPIRAGEQQGGQDGRGDQRGVQDGQRDGGQRDGGRQGGNRQDGNRQDTQRDGRDNGNRQQGQRDGQPRYDNQPRYEGRRDEPRTEEARPANGARRYAEEGDRGNQQRGDEQDRSSERFAVTGSPIANDLGEDSPDGAEPSPVEPRRRGRPRRVAADVAPVAVEAEAPAALDADRLPPALAPALAVVSEPTVEEGEAPRPRRRRVRAAGGDVSPLG